MPAPNYSFVESQNLDLPILLKPEDCRGRTFIVTGANTGLGYECAKRLVLLESARIIITVRDLKKGEAAKAKIEAEAQRQNVIKVYHLDLASFDNIRAFVHKVETEVDRVDGVIANAGTSNGVWIENEGMEGNLTVNLFSNFLLLALTQPYLKSMRDKFGTTPHFTFVGSMAPFVAPESPLLEVNRDDIFGDLNNKEKRGKREMSLQYPLSKLLLLFATRQLAARVSAAQNGVIVNITEPGMCKTGLSKNLGWTARLIAWVALKLLGRTPEMGSRAILAGLALGEESHGTFVSDCKVKDDRIPDWLTNEDGQIWQNKVWEQLASRMEQIQPGCLSWVSAK